MARTYLVTGAVGFIGTALCRYLDSIKVSYRSVGRREFPHLKKILQRIRPGVIFHLAGGRAFTNSKMVEDNILTTIELFETIRAIADYHPRVMVVGSAAEYGRQAHGFSPIREDSACKPIGFYGWVKLLETMCALHYAKSGSEVVVARLFNIIGPGIPQEMAAGQFARQITALEKRSSAKALTIADLSGARDFLDIRDIVGALVILSLKGKSGEIYNICSEQKTLMRDLLSGMISASQKPSIKFKEDKKSKPGVLYAIGSAAKFKKLTSWQPKINLHQSIKDTLEYYRKKGTL